MPALRMVSDLRLPMVAGELRQVGVRFEEDLNTGFFCEAARNRVKSHTMDCRTRFLFYCSYRPESLVRKGTKPLVNGAQIVFHPTFLWNHEQKAFPLLGYDGNVPQNAGIRVFADK